jgi:TATA-box binding protein (TBP) (component of TFIID and TFIIIB)
MNVFQLKNWSIVGFMDSIRLTGEVYGNERFEDGSLITTSVIKCVDGKIVTTKSKSIYQLNEPSKSYLEFLNEIGYEYNQDAPIKVLKDKKK